MKLTITFIMLLFVSVFFSQGETNNWCFGNGGGVNFATGSPIAINNSAMNQREGNATISDDLGNLLFYTHGATIWDASHNPMQNGTGLLGQPTSAQSAVIVKMPGSDSLYYVFTVSDWTNTTGSLSYSIVDMSLNGGLGAVNATRNIVLNNLCREQVSAVLHRNCRDVWIVSHEMQNANFVSYLLTPTGLNIVPVTSTVGLVSNGGNRYGGLKFSSNGQKICSALGGAVGTQTLQVCDFNLVTGVVSNSISLNSTNRIYSPEFSMNAKVLYTVAFNGNYINQYDLTLGSAAAISASMINVANGATIKSCLQMGIDSNIYVSLDNRSFMGVINNPSILGLGCGYVDNAIPLGAGRTCRLGFPNFVQSYLPNVTTTKTDTIMCFGDSLFLESTDTSTDGYLWQDNTTVTKGITIYTPGTYWVDYIVNCRNYVDTFVVMPDTVGPLVSCHDTNLYLNSLGSLSIDTSYILTSIYENCGLDSVWLSDTIVTCINDSVLVTIYATDGYGNIDSCTAKIVVMDTIAPIVNCMDTVIYLPYSSNVTIDTSYVVAFYDDNCTVDSVWMDKKSFSCLDVGVNQVKVYARDNSGNIDSCSSQVTIIDSIAPSVVCKDTLLYVGSIGSFNIDTSYILVSSSDNCGVDSLWLNKKIFDCSNIGINRVTIYAKDSSGNVDSCTANLTLLDTLSPVINCRDAIVYMNMTGTVVFDTSYVVNSIDENCTLDTVWMDYNMVECGDDIVYVTTYAKDESGNIDSCNSIITVIDTIQCNDSLLQLEREYLFYVPNAFTPDGDGINDVFIPVHNGIKDMTMYIFDRWGELIFQGSGLENGWDGTYKSNDIVQDGVYVYRILARSLDLKWKEYIGHVTLFR